MAAFRYTHAIVCRIPLSLRTRGEIELEEAKKQHENYVRLLRELGLDVIELPPDEALPECVFVEDTAVVCNGTALITRPGAAHRAKEVETIRVVLKKELDLPLIEMSDAKARLDGGDVLFTGREFFVGISQWTNEAGARAVAVAFPEYPCTPIKFGDVIVTLPNGQIRGLEKLSARNHTFYAFMQVPYAEPPLGKLRFKDPQPLKNWEGVLNATNEKTICYQVSSNSEMESENCLYVSVYTPVHPESNSSLPVMFYIHGGGFTDGYSLYSVYGPHRFMDYGVVIVTVAYRLGPFGFLSTRDSVIPGNYGLKDQTMALKWIQQNIRYFGGDPAKVTIFGQSSGAVSVGYHILSKQSTGLFRGAIQQSGSALAPHGYQRRAKDYAYALGKFIDPNFNKSGSIELLAFLQNVSAATIDAASQKFIEEPGYTIISEGSWFVPVIESKSEEAFITENMYESFACGNINKVPLITGMTSEEFGSVVSDLDAFKKVIEPYDENVTLLLQADMHITDQNIKVQVGNAIRRIYMDGLLQDHLAQAVKYCSDAFISKPVMRHAELQSKYTDVYFYQFSYDGALGMNNASIEGDGKVTHSEDNNYLWVVNNATDINSIDSNDLRTVDRYLKLFTDFSKTLNPTSEPQELLENIKWPKVTEHSFRYLDIGENLNIKINPKEPAYKKWVSIYERWGVKPFDTY